MQRLLGYLAASVHSRLNRLQNHSTYFSQCRATAKHIALICRRKKILPTSLNYCDYLIYLLQPKKLDVCALWTIETDRFTSLDGFQSGFGWRGTAPAVIRGTTSGIREINWTFTIVQGGTTSGIREINWIFTIVQRGPYFTKKILLRKI